MKYFLLDKEFAIQNQARCIGISDKPFTQEEIEKAKLIYKTKKTIIFQGNDIPAHIGYDPINDTVVEKKESKIQKISTYSEVATQEEKMFDEDVEVEQNVYYFYIDKKIADTEFIAVNIANFKKPLLNPNEYFQKEVYEIKGREYPNYITVEGGVVRESTKYEQYTRDQYQLQDREVAFKGEIIYLEEGWYIEGEELIKVPKPKGVNLEFNEESHVWEERASQEEIKKAYCDLIVDYQNQVMEAGFIWTHQHSDGSSKTHIQRVRQGIDIPILETAISSLADARAVAEQKSEIPLIASYPWSFDDLGEDICELTETELRELRLVGNGVFGVAVYKTSGILKQKDPNLSITLNDFLTELEKHTNISALLNKGDEIN